MDSPDGREKIPTDSGKDKDANGDGKFLHAATLAATRIRNTPTVFRRKQRNAKSVLFILAIPHHAKFIRKR